MVDNYWQIKWRISTIEYYKKYIEELEKEVQELASSEK